MKKMYDIHKLVEKFMAGETSLAEEQYLYHYFAEKCVDDDLLPMRELILGLGSIQDPGEQKAARPFATRKLIRIASAAAIALVLVASAALWIDASMNYSVAYIYGKKTTDVGTIRSEVVRTMDDIDMQGTNSVDGQLQDVLMTDQ